MQCWEKVLILGSRGNSVIARDGWRRDSEFRVVSGRILATLSLARWLFVPSQVR